MRSHAYPVMIRGIGEQVRVTPVPRAANLETSGVAERASGIRMRVSVKGIDMTTTAPPAPPETIRSVLLGLLGVPPSIAVESTAVSPDDAVAQPDTAKVYEFTSVDYPGAAQTLIFDTDGTTALGAFVFNPGNASSQVTAFTVAGGNYQILNVANSTASIATGINTSGLIVGVYQDVAGSAHGLQPATAAPSTTLTSPEPPTHRPST